MNPRTSSLQEVLVLFLKASAHYALKLYENDIVDEKIKEIEEALKTNDAVLLAHRVTDTIKMIDGDKLKHGK